MLTLHPQSAMEHLHHRFVADGGAGSDGAIAFEAAEVSATARGRAPVPVKPAEPLAGAPDRSPIPLADNVQAAGVAVSAAAGNARVAAGGAMEKVVGRVQELMPRRKPAYRRVTPLASRRETQRRAALAVLALLVVAAGLGLGVYVFGGQGQPGGHQLGQRGPGGPRHGQGEPRQGQGPRRRSRRGRPGPGQGAPDRGVSAARRRRGGQRQRRGHRAAAQAGDRRSRPPLRRRAGGLVDDLHLQAWRGRRPDRPRGPGQGTRRRARTSSTARPRPSTASTSRPRRPRSWPGPARRPTARPSRRRASWPSAGRTS